MPQREPICLVFGSIIFPIYVWRHDDCRGLSISSREHSQVLPWLRVVGNVVGASERFSEWLAGASAETVKALITEDSGEPLPWKSGGRTNRLSDESAVGAARAARD